LNWGKACSKQGREKRGKTTKRMGKGGTFGRDRSVMLGQQPIPYLRRVYLSRDRKGKIRKKEVGTRREKKIRYGPVHWATDQEK